jgi:hypothetical protein
MPSVSVCKSSLPGRKTGYPEPWYQQDPSDDGPRQLYEMPTLGPCGIFLQRRLVNTGALVRTYPDLTRFPDSPRYRVSANMSTSSANSKVKR